MRSSAATETRAAERAAAVEIGVGERRDALRLMEALIPFHSFLVQYERERWVVHARVPGCHGETLDDLLAAVEDCWRDDQGVPLRPETGRRIATWVGPPGTSSSASSITVKPKRA